MGMWENIFQPASCVYAQTPLKIQQIWAETHLLIMKTCTEKFIAAHALAILNQNVLYVFPVY